MTTFTLILCSTLLFGISDEFARFDKPCQQVRKGKYCNSRYEFCLNYSPSDFPIILESDNGDGCTFTSSNRDRIVRAFGLGRSPEDTIQELIRRRIQYYKTKDISINYSFSGKNFFVLSGQGNKKLIYERYILKSDNWVVFQLESTNRSRSLFARQCKTLVSSIQ